METFNIKRMTFKYTMYKPEMFKNLFDKLKRLYILQIVALKLNPISLKREAQMNTFI